MGFFQKNKQNIFKILKFLGVILILYLILEFLGGFFAPFIFGYILCLILSPIYKFFQKLNFPKHISSILCIAIFIFIIGFIGAGLFGQILKEGKEFAENIPYYRIQVQQTFDNLRLKIQSLLEILPDYLEQTLNNLYYNSKGFIGEFLGTGIKNTSFKFIKMLPNTFMVIVLGLISCFLILIDKENIEAFILRQFPKKYSEKMLIIKTSIFETLMGYIKAQLIIMCFIGTICFIGLSIIKAPYALLLGFIIAVVDALPVFGSGFILWPWSIYNLIVKNYKFSVGLIIIYLIILIVRQTIEPKIVGKQIGIHPLVTLMSIYIGLKIFGVFGFIIGPCIMVILKALQTENILPKWR